jgi:hypothetical protein
MGEQRKQRKRCAKQDFLHVSSVSDYVMKKAGNAGLCLCLRKSEVHPH